ncbi:uncharacterized protein LODBEIA_P32150 [Lodderomyces beijingensis]|uniref:Genetic interactor of prohibitins 3, mitochondrial n=1 Tax=Lodderomyces beijingensis TaxID=1775926 RepID=A0ABP0ZPD7_9ASCO
MIPRIIPKRILLAQVRWSSSIAIPYLHSMEARCRSCGVKLQNKNRDELGYYIAKKAETDAKAMKPADKVYSEKFKGLSKEDHELLLSNDFGGNNESRSASPSSPPDDVSSTSPLDSVRKMFTLNLNENDIDCLRCRSAIYQSKYTMDKTEFPIKQLQHVLAKIPDAAPIVYLVSATDFPMGLNRAILQFRPASQVRFILTKVDRLVQRRHEASYDYIRTFFADYMHVQYGVPKQNTFISSSSKSWNMEALDSFIPEGAYIVGSTNCGKSTLIKSLMLRMDLHDKRQFAYRLPFKMAKNLKGQYRREFEKKIGPGMSHLPGFTREIIPVAIGLKTVYDVPGFNNNAQIHHLLNRFKSPSMIPRLMKGQTTYDRGLFNSKYESFKGPNVVSFSGLAYLQLAPGCHYQVRNVTNFDTHAFSNLDKAKAVAVNVPRALENKFAIKDIGDGDARGFDGEFDCYMIPPFHGAIDLVFENFGYVNIKPTGARSSNELMKLYVVPGMHVVIRQPISDYILKTFSGVDGNGNVLKKEHWFDKSTFRLKRFDGKSPLYSRLVPFDSSAAGAEAPKANGEEVDSDRRRRGEEYSQFNKHLNTSGKVYGDEYVLDESNKYHFWIE